MAPDLRPQDLAVMQEVFRRYSEIQSVRLFGSRSQGKAKRASDIDLAVDAPGMGPGKWAEFRSDMEALPVILEYDLIRWDELRQSPIRNKILQDGVLIFP